QRGSEAVTLHVRRRHQQRSLDPGARGRGRLGSPVRYGNAAQDVGNEDYGTRLRSDTTNQGITLVGTARQMPICLLDALGAGQQALPVALPVVSTGALPSGQDQVSGGSCSHHDLLRWGDSGWRAGQLPAGESGPRGPVRITAG